jgi:FxLD family lantipeptide
MGVTVHPQTGWQWTVDLDEVLNDRRSCLINTQTLDHPVAENAGGFDLDVSIVEAGDAVNALLCSTDNGCDTQKDGDC